MKQMLLVFVGAGVGGVLRHAAGPWLQGLAERWVHLSPGGGATAFPAGTLAVNITGCLAAGVLGGLLGSANGSREDVRVLVMVGILGGYTTFSAFGRETVMLLLERRVGEAALYVVLSAAAGLAAVWIGMKLSGALAPQAA